MSILEKAIDLAVVAHRGQIDEDGFPHIIHSMEVMSSVHRELDMLATQNQESISTRLARKKYTNEQILAAAVLHDTVEDSNGVVTVPTLLRAFGHEIADIVDSLTRRGADDDKEFYRDFIYRAKDNPAGRLIKVCDLVHNLGRTHRIGPKKAKWRQKLEYKYRVALHVLNDQDEPTWEGASWEVHWHDNGALRVPIFYLADPNGKRITLTKEELKVKAYRASFRYNDVLGGIR